jgi:hypothetical protein
MATYRFRDGDTVGFMQGSTLTTCKVMPIGQSGTKYMCDHDNTIILDEDNNDKLHMRLVKKAEVYGGSRRSRRSRRSRKNKRKTRRSRK